MPWGWILSALGLLAGLVVLALALFQVRLRAAWGGAWESLDSRQAGTFRVEYGFPGFMREWTWEDDDEDEGGRGGSTSRPSRPDGDAPVRPDPASRPSTPSTDAATRRDPAPDSARDPLNAASSSAPSTPSAPSSPRKARSRNRWRRALFRFVTDGKTWRLLARHGYRTARGLLALLKPRVAIAVGHPDPVLLGRVAAAWHAAAPLTASTRMTLELRFQDHRPTFAIRAEGGFSALSFVGFGLRNASTFPWIGLGRRAWHSWWRHELRGWRRWAYRSLQG